MLKKITGVIITMSVLFSMFLTTPVYAATKKVATEIKEITGVEAIYDRSTSEEAYDKAWNQITNEFGEKAYSFSNSLSYSNKYASIMTDEGPVLYNLKSKKMIPTEYLFKYMNDNRYAPIALVRIDTGNSGTYFDRENTDGIYDDNDNGRGFKLLDLKTGKIITPYGDNVVRMQPIYNYNEEESPAIGIAVYKSDGTAIIDYLNGKTKYEYENIDIDNTHISADSKYIYIQNNDTLKLYDIKTNKLLLITTDSIFYNEATNLYLVIKYPSNNRHINETIIYNPEGKVLGRFNTSNGHIGETFLFIDNHNTLNKYLINYHYFNDEKWYEIIY